MANIKIKIEVNPDGDTESLGSAVSDNRDVANTSLEIPSSGKITFPQEQSQGSNGLSWALDELEFSEDDELINIGDDAQFRVGELESEENPEQFIWGVVSPLGEYSVKTTFSNANNLESIVVLGDRDSDQFPTKAIIDGKTTITNEQPEWSIDLGDPSDTHSIEFVKWNRANYNACLSSITVLSRYLEVGKHDGIESINSLSQSNPSSDVFYGSLANSGMIELIDVNQNILNSLKNIMEKSPNRIPVDLYLNNKLAQKHTVKNSSFSISDNKLTLDLGNGIDALYIDVGPVYLLDSEGNRTLEADSLYNLTLALFAKVGKEPQDVDAMMTSFVYRGKANNRYTVKSFLEKIIIEFPYFSPATLRENIDKICSLAQLNFIAKDNGDYSFVDARPICNKLDKYIKIPNKYVFDSLKYNPLSSLKIKSVGKKERTVSHSYSPVKEFRCSTYSQTQTTGFSDDKIFYSGILNDYTQKISIDDADSSILGIYPLYIDDTTHDSKTQNALIKTSFILDEDFITSHKKWFAFFSSYNQNKLPYSIYPSSESSTFLLNENIELDNSIFDNANFPFVYVNSEDEAIDNLCYRQNGAIISAKIGGDNWGTQIIRDGSKYTLYFLQTVTSAGTLTNYTGELSHIILNGSIKIVTDKILVSMKDETNEQYDYVINDSEIMQSGTTFIGETMYNIQQDNLLSDYKRGVLSGTATICCGDLYYNNGEVAKIWSNGDILEVGDFVSFDGDLSDGEQRIWRVSGRKFVYDAKPMINLELTELMPAETARISGLYKHGTNEMIYTWQQLIDNGYITVGTFSGNNKFSVLDSSTEFLDGDLSIDGSIEYIADRAFSNFNSTSTLKSVEIPISVTGIAQLAFYGNKELIGVSLPSSVVAETGRIGPSVFHECQSLKEISFPEGTTVIQESTCRQCYNLEKISFPSSLIEIHEHAFASCWNSLKDVDLPQGLKVLKDRAFGGCMKIKHIYIPSSVDTISGSPFSGIGLDYSTIKIYCGALSKPSGWDEDWNLFSESINIDTGETTKEYHPNVFWGYTKAQYLEETKNS